MVLLFVLLRISSLLMNAACLAFTYRQSFYIPCNIPSITTPDCFRRSLHDTAARNTANRPHVHHKQNHDYWLGRFSS
jgi:hypothetical protein